MKSTAEFIKLEQLLFHYSNKHSKLIFSTRHQYVFLIEKTIMCEQLKSFTFGEH